MSYENPQVPHEVNVSRESVLVEFVRLSLGLALLVLLGTGLLYFFGGALARLVPYSIEARIVGDSVVAPVSLNDGGAAESTSEVRAYLQQIADELARDMDLPEGMRPVMHWSEVDVPNAFATLGGHVIVTRGLYRRMPSENALAMVMAHELAHLQARDPISAVGGSASLALVLVLLGGDVDRLTPALMHAVQLGYSRRAESRADAAAVEALIARYGHAGGAAAVFEVLGEYAGPVREAVPPLLSTHPADAERIRRVEKAAAGWDEERAPLKPMAIAVE